MVRETRHLWVGNLPENIREDRIIDHFKRYGKVQSVKILPNSRQSCKSDDSSSGLVGNCTTSANNISGNVTANNATINNASIGVCATVAFIDLKSATKAHGSENKIEERTLKTDYYEPPASSTALSAIYIHEREDANSVQKPGANISVYGNANANSRPARHTPSRLSDERIYDRERTGSCNNYERIVDRDTAYIKRNIGYLDDNEYSNRSRSRDRPFNRVNNSYQDGIDRSVAHFRPYARNNSQTTHFDAQRYSSSEQIEETGVSNASSASSTQRGSVSRRITSVTTSSGGVSSTVSSPPHLKPLKKKKKKKQSVRSHSASPSPSRSRSSSLSSARSQSPSSSSNISTSSSTSSRSRSPSKSQSPLALYNNRKVSTHCTERPISGNNSAVLISAVTTTTNNISTSSQGSNHTPLHNSNATPGSDSSADKDDTRPVAICVKNLPVRSTDSSLKDGLFHEYKKHGKVTMVKVVGQGTDRFAVVCFKKPEDVEKALEESKDKLFFGCKIEVSAHEGIDAEDNDFRPLEAELDEHHPKATRTLFVGNLEKDVSTSDLKSHFEQFGEIIEIDIKKQGTLSSYAFIQFSDISSVVKAMRKLDGENLGANRIKLGFGKSMPTNCVWIHGVSELVTDKALSWQANRFGTVVHLVIDRERFNALIFYDNVECAQIAVADLKGRVLNGRKLQVDFASRECQTAFFDYLELSGQITAGERPWERRTNNNSTNWNEFDERLSNYDPHNNNRGHSRYQSRTSGRSYRPQSPLPPFQRTPQTSYSGRGRGYRFQDGYQEEFADRRHRNYDLEELEDNDESYREDDRELCYRDRNRDINETCSKAFSPLRRQTDGSESPKERHDCRSASPYSRNEINNSRIEKLDAETHSLKDRCIVRSNEDVLIHDGNEWKPTDLLLDRINNRRNKHKSAACDSDILCHSPTTRRHSHSISPIPKDKKTVTAIGNNNGTPQSPTASPCSSSFASPLRNESVDIDADKEFEPSCGSSNVWRRKSMDDNNLELNDNLRLRSNSVSDSSENGLLRESIKRKHIDSDSPETPTSSEAIGHLERKKRLLACHVESLNIHKDRSGGNSNVIQANSSKSDNRRAAELEPIVTSESVKSELAKLLKRRSSSSSGANSDIKYLESKSKQGCVMSLIEQCFFGENNDTSSHHSLDNSVNNVDSKTSRKHNSNSFSTKSGKCSYGAKETVNAVPLRIIDATSPLVNHSWPDPRRQSLLSSSSLSSMSLTTAQLCSSHINCKVHRKLERTDAYEMSCDSDVLVLSRVSSSDIECHDRTQLKQDVVHSTTPKLEDHCSSEVSSSSDKVAAMNKRPSQPLFGRSLTCPAMIGPLLLPLPEFAVTIRAEANNKVANIPVVQPSHASPKSTTIMSPLGNLSPNSVVPKKLREKSDLMKDGLCLVSTTDNPDSNNLNNVDVSKISVISSSKLKSDAFEEVSDPEMSPTRSPNRSIEDRIRALDEKYNAWSGTNATTPVVKMEKTPTPTIDYSKYNIKKKSQINSTSSTDSQTSEPSDIVKNLLSKSSIFDQDSKRLELINEKYEPKEVNYELLTSSPKSKPVFRTKAAAKEFSTPTSSMPSIPTEKSHQTPHDSLPKNALIHHHSQHQSSHHSLHTHPHTHTQLHHNHPIPGSLPRKLSEPTRMPSIKKEPTAPLTPTSQAPNSAPPRSGPNNPFAPFSRTHSNSSTLTRLPQPNLLGGINIKKESTIPLPINSITGKDVPKSRDPRENRDPRVLAKKDNALHSSIIVNTSTLNMQNINLKDHHQSSIKKEVSSLPSSTNMPFVKSEFAKKASQLQQHSSSLPPHLASSSFSSKAQNPSFPAINQSSTQRQDLNKKSDLQASTNKRHTSTDALESHIPSSESEWSRIVTTDLKDKSIKTEKMRHYSQSSSTSKDVSEGNSAMVSQKKLVDKDNKKCDTIKQCSSTDKSKNPIFNKLKDDKKTVKKESSKTQFMSKSDFKEKMKSKLDIKTEKKSDISGKSLSNKSSKFEIKDKDREKDKIKKEKSSSKEKSKDTKLKPSELKMLLDIPDTDEPIYFSMYDKVKARSSANQSLKVAKDLESVRQKFSQLKDRRQNKKDEERNKTSQETTSDSDDSHYERIKYKQKRQNLPKKRKIIIDTTSDSSSSDDEINSLLINKKSRKRSPVTNESDFDSDLEKLISKPNKKLNKDTIYNSDSSNEDLSTISSPRMTSNSINKLSKNIKSKLLDDDSSDDEVPLKQIKKKKDMKKRVKSKEKEKEKLKEKEKSELNKDNAAKDVKEVKADKVEKICDNKPKPVVNDNNKGLLKVKKNKLMKEHDKEKERKRSSDDTEDSKLKIAKRKKKKAKTSKLKDRKHSSSKDKSNDENKSMKHSDSSLKQELVTSDHDMRSSGMSDLEECLKRAYPEVKSDDSDSETRTHVIKCYNKEQTRGVVSHTEWEKSETTKPSEKSANKMLSKPIEKTEKALPCPLKLENKEKDKEKEKDKDKGNKSPKKLNKEPQVTQKDVDICKKKEKDVNKSNKDDKLNKDKDKDKDKEEKKKKLKKQSKDKDREKDKKDDKEKIIDKQIKEKKNKLKLDNLAKIDNLPKVENFSKFENLSKIDNLPKFENLSKIENLPKLDALPKIKSPEIPLMSPKMPEIVPNSPFSDIVPHDNDSPSSDSKLDEDLIENARRLEKCLMAADGSDDSSSNDDILPTTTTPTKPNSISNIIIPSKDEKLQNLRRYEEEAAIQSLRLQKELMETSDSKDIKRPFDELMSPSVASMKSDTDVTQTETKPIIDETLFAINNSSNKDMFLDSETDIKIDENKECELDDQRKMEDDLAVAALLQDMNDPVIKDNDEHEEYLPPNEQIDELSYMRMLDEEEPPLQIAENSPLNESLNEDTILKNITEVVSEKLNSNVRDELDVCKPESDTNIDKVVPICEPIEEPKKELFEWHADVIDNKYSGDTSVELKEHIDCSSDNITVKHNSPQIEVPSEPEQQSQQTPIEEETVKQQESVEIVKEKEHDIQFAPISIESTVESSNLMTSKIEEVAIETDTNLCSNIIDQKQPEKESVTETEDRTETSNLANVVTDNVCDDKRDTCSNGSEKTEIFEDDVETEPQTESIKETNANTFVALDQHLEIASNAINPPSELKQTRDMSVIESRDESESDEKRTCERPRRGRRAKTRKYSESSLQLPRYETGCVSSNASSLSAPAAISIATTKRIVKPVERARRSGRNSGMENLCNDEHNENELSSDEQPLKIEEHVPQMLEEEPKKCSKRGRKKKISGTFITSDMNKPLSEELRQKERILLSLPIPTDKISSDVRKTNSPYDVFEFRDSDEEDGPQLPLEPIHNKSIEINKQQQIHAIIPEPEPKKSVIEETVVTKSVDHTQDQTSKEYVTELSQHPKLSITIRLHSKEGQDGNSGATAEVVKTSKALSEDDTKVGKVTETAAENNQTKGVRKSARLMQQVPKTTIDETIEDVIKNTFKEEIKSKRITRSSRKSEENIELDDEHNEESKNSLRSYRITRSSTRGSISADNETVGDNPLTPLSQEVNDNHSTQRRHTLPQLPVLKVELPKIGIQKTNEITSKKKFDDIDTPIITTIPPPSLPPPLPPPTPTTATIVANKESNSEVIEGDDSRLSPAVLLDPVTGILEPVKKAFEHTTVIQGGKPMINIAAITTSNTNQTTTSPTSVSTATATPTATPYTPVTPVTPTLLPIITTASVITTTSSTNVITTSQSVITSACIQDIPNISERIHHSTTAMKLKTGKGFILDEKIITSTHSAHDTASVTATTNTITTQSNSTTATITSQSQPITITPKYPLPVGQQPLAPIGQPMPVQWQQNIVPNPQSSVQMTQPSIQSHAVRAYPSQSQPVVTSVSSHRSLPTTQQPFDTKICKQEIVPTQSQPQPPPAHSKVNVEVKPPSMPTSVVTSHSSEQVITPSMHSKTESRSATNLKSTKSPQVVGYATLDNMAHIASASNTPLQTQGSSSNSGVIAELLQNPHVLQHHQKEYLANMPQPLQQHSNLRDSAQSSALELQSNRNSNPTPPGTPSPQNPLIQSHMAGLAHMRPPSQPPLMVPPHHIGIHQNELAMYEHMRQQMMYMQQHPHYSQLPADLRAHQEAQVRAAMNMQPRFVYPSGNFSMPMSAETKSQESANKEQRLQEERAIREKNSNKQKESGRESVGRLSQQEEAEYKMQAEAEMKRQAEAHALASMQPPPPLAPLRIPPGMQYPPAIRQFNPHLLSPHERYTDSPAIVHTYNQGRVHTPSHPIPPQLRTEEIKQQESMRRSPVVKIDETRKYQNAEFAAAIHRQQLSSPSTSYMDNRSMQPPSHSPGSMPYRKEATRSPMPPINESEMHRKQMASQYPPKDMTSSPGPIAINMSQAMASQPHIQMSHTQQQQQQQHMQNEGLMRRSMQPVPHLGSEPPIHGPPPAHAISQPPLHLPHTPQHASQVPPHGDVLLQRYPVMWQGLLALKNDQAAVQMHYVSGNARIAHSSLPPFTEGGVSPLRIAQRMRLEQTQLQGLGRKIQSVDEHCILLALPCGRDHMDVLQQSNNLRNGFITYLTSKQAAGIVNINAPGSQQPAYVIHIFPTCDFSQDNLVRIAPDLLHSLSGISHLLIVIATV